VPMAPLYHMLLLVTTFPAILAVVNLSTCLWSRRYRSVLSDASAYQMFPVVPSGDVTVTRTFTRLPRHRQWKPVRFTVTGVVIIGAKALLYRGAIRPHFLHISYWP
jgi:hypothetical protein